MIEALARKLASAIKGEVQSDSETRARYAQDASIFYVEPEAVAFPKDISDIRKIIHFVRVNRAEDKTLSISPRGAGTDMSGGSLTGSLLVDLTKYIHGVVSINDREARVLPGTFFRDLEREMDRRGIMMPSFPASKNLCTVGGMVANNSAGEKTLSYGKTDEYVKELKVLFSDGNEYVIRPLNEKELDQKCSEKNFEGSVYRGVRALIEKNYDAVVRARPAVSKNSAGYALWDVWDGRKFDLTKLIVGSQGTLGVVTEIVFKLVPKKPKTKLAVIFLDSLTELGSIVNDILATKPETLESYDDQTFVFAVKFFRNFLRQKGIWGSVRLAFSFIPEFFMVLSGGVPKLILLVEYAESKMAEADKKSSDLAERMKKYKMTMRFARSPMEAEKYWSVRRESFNLLRHNVGGSFHTAPFIDDIVVRPEYLPEFLPKLNKILKEYPILYTIAGHVGNGNFHIIPLMNFSDPKTPGVIFELSDRVYDLVFQYRGSISGEHNDGIIRTPYLEKMFGKEVTTLFAEVKNIFDPEGIFNPGKKVGGTFSYAREHIHHENANNHAS